MRRRDFITLIAGATAWPLAARAQQPAMPVVGFLHAATAEANAHNVTAFQRGLTEAGYVEGKNVTIEYHFINFRPELMREAAGDLIRRNVSVIFAAEPSAVVVVRNATTSIPGRGARFGKRSSCERVRQESCTPGRQYDGNVS